MQLTAEEEGRVYVYTENVWTGKKELTLDGVPLEKINKKTFSVKDAAGNARPLELSLIHIFFRGGYHFINYRLNRERNRSVLEISGRGIKFFEGTLPTPQQEDFIYG